MKIVFASNNSHKLMEIRSIIGNGCELLSLGDLNITADIPEEEPTLEGNALAKARFVKKLTALNVFADDTGLEVEALGGLPGVKSARFAGENCDSSANIDLLLSMLAGNSNRKARFRTVFALIYNGTEYIMEGIVDGTITGERKGGKGFGYDPVFIPCGSTKTFAEMELSEKNMVSHRARALEKLYAELNRLNGTCYK
ncbi:MAG: RdgB/HAM1 family non-canonical purine NTP pyrophosphatase [Bacteroidales bacterium]|jgi:XTP/dITP diphosphohydrolase|nr:RdgB/HAM1 family non-canonical purine NTP pyrophosphatase [Bacteroidales bacterium]